MSDYLKSTNFATKDSLPSGNAGKIVKGTEIDNELNAIADAVESKADLLNPVFSGLLTTDTLATGGATNIGGTLAVASTLSAAADVQFTGTGRVLFPKGTTAQRPASPTAGSTRWNTDLNYLENYNGTVWEAVGEPTPADVSDEVNTSTGYFQVPVGTLGQRPASPANGLIRYNSASNYYEAYVNSRWHRFVTADLGEYSLSYLIAGGGGSGGYAGNPMAGGGGAGGFLTGTLSRNVGNVITVTVGAGGASGANGSDSSITGVATAYGGGAGGASVTNGSNGASGGGGGSRASYGTSVGGQGNRGGNGDYDSGGGGGGFGGIGGNAGDGGGSPNRFGGYGGVGVSSAVGGTSLFYCGGGGGGGVDVAGTGGNGGGGAGAQNIYSGRGTGFGPTAGGAATGGGGGGGALGNPTGANGGSGVVVLAVPTANYSGSVTGSPTVTSGAGYTYIKFTNSGTYTA